MKRVLLVLPYDMSVRTFLRSGLLSLLAEQNEVEIHIVSRSPADVTAIDSGLNNIFHYPVIRPFRRDRFFARLIADLRYVIGYFIHLSLVYRFNSIAGFRGFLDRLQQSSAARHVAAREGLPSLRRLGFPFPRSRNLYDILQKLYWAAFAAHRDAERVLETVRPDLVVLFHLQTHFVAPWHKAAMRRSIPVVGVVGSWDQPSTKGPCVPGLSAVAAQSRLTGEHLRRWHDMADIPIKIIGWPQMDIYARPDILVPRAEFLLRMGLEPSARYVLLGAYSERLGSHEPEVARRLGEAARAGRFGSDCHIWVRSHPLDMLWQERFRTLFGQERVHVEAPQMGDLDYLANLIAHADCVIASAGTINLDAVALDRPSIGLAFEDETLPFYDRSARRYAMEHIADAVATGGLRLVRSHDELADVVAQYSAEPSQDAAGRKALREALLEPLDGRSSQRLAEFVVTNLERDR